MRACVCGGKEEAKFYSCRVMPEVAFADIDSRAGPSRVAVCVSATALFSFSLKKIFKKSNGYSGNCLIISVSVLSTLFAKVLSLDHELFILGGRGIRLPGSRRRICC